MPGDAKITDEDREADVLANKIDRLLQRCANPSCRTVYVEARQELFRSAIANARQAGREEAAAIAQKYLDGYSPDIFTPLTPADQAMINRALDAFGKPGNLRARVSADMGRRTASNIIDEINALGDTK